jgi:AmmeMemoRadiSam system protein B
MLLSGSLVALVFTAHSVSAAALVRNSPYGQDAEYFERAAIALTPAQQPQLDEVFGGVVTHHIPNAAELITDFYARLAAVQSVDTFVIVGPDHFERGIATVTVSHAQFTTPFGTVLPDERLIGLLEERSLIVHDESAFDDHAVHSQLLAISRVFPKAKVVALLFRSKGSNEAAARLGKEIAAVAGPRTVVVASVDFSHYLTADQARPLDLHAAQTLALLRPDLAGVAEADSPQALTAMMAAVTSLGATRAQTLGVHNSDEFSSRRSDVTTGYVVQYYGTPKHYAPFTGALRRMGYHEKN